MSTTVRAAGGELKHRFEHHLHSRGVDADLRQLRYFIAVAEELHFTRAAARLHMAQQPLSAAIRRFETELGVELFARTTRRVELTHAGRALLEPARVALRAADEALAAATAASPGVAGELQFGLSSGARYGVEPLFAALAHRHPALHLHIRQDSAGLLLADVCDGRLDMAVTFAAEVPGELEHLRLKNDVAVLAVAASHPLAARESIALSELQDETFALDVPGGNAGYDSGVIEACRRSGFDARTRASSAVHHAWERLVANEGCVGLTVRSAVQAAHRDLRLLTLDQPLTFPIELAWRTATGTVLRSVEAVVNTARDVREEQHWR